MYLNQRKNELAQIVSYTPPRLYTGKEWYVGWYSYDPVLQQLRRKKIKVNHIHPKIERRKYAYDLVTRVYEKLRRGRISFDRFPVPEGFPTVRYGRLRAAVILFPFRPEGH